MKIIILLTIFSLFTIPLFSETLVEAQQQEGTTGTTRINHNPVLVIETTQGNLVMEFFHNDAPNHFQNFLYLSSSGYYDGTLFHRIIPGFMIQGGDPNTVNGDSSTWGQGGPDERIDAEFNTIKHNRGIVSMARSADPNSAGSQFFIVHKDSNFLDGEYTVFGRIVTEESFETLDKIAAAQTGDGDIPINPESVRIITTYLEGRESHNLLELGEPERTESALKQSTGYQTFESQELDISFSAPEGWLLQQPDANISGAPDVAVVGPKISGINPVISLTIETENDKTIDDLIREKNETLAEAVYLNKLEILSQEKIKTNVYQTEAVGTFERDDTLLKIKFLEVLIFSEPKSYTFAYSNSIDNFNNELPKFNESLNSFKILSQDDSIIKSSTEKSIEEGGGCLIATATYGSELAPQVQQLRELRDNQLLNTESGTIFMSGFNELYYSFSPTIADMEREHPLFKEVIKITITPMISSLSLMENAESESEVLGLGLSVIALNLGMYIGLPAIVIVGIRKKF